MGPWDSERISTLGIFDFSDLWTSVESIRVVKTREINISIYYMAVSQKDWEIPNIHEFDWLKSILKAA